uniref:Uncharacterized protein n=1 Tax=Schizaphis graminum TaxID=13262 RepID=A0A2S2NF91_SCHGA
MCSMRVVRTCTLYIQIIMRTMRYLQYVFTGGHTAERKLRAGIDRQEMTQTRAVDFHSTRCRIWITRPSGQPATIIHTHIIIYSIIRAHSIGGGGSVHTIILLCMYNVLLRMRTCDMFTSAAACMTCTTFTA